jgi:golgin subfamily B member 1
VSTTFRKLGQSELLPRYIFAESLYARRRVLEIGGVATTEGQSAQFLALRGARLVVAADADSAAVQRAQAKLGTPTLRFRPPIFDDFETGSFDLVMVADLAPYVRAPELLRDIARLVARNGVLMGGLRNPSGLALSTMLEPEEGDAPPTYGQLLDALQGYFRSIEVATQSPVVGYQLAFERGDGLQVDGSLAGHSEAAYFVVLAGHEPVRSFDPTWVQLPPEPLAFAGGKLDDAFGRAKDWKERAERLKEALAQKSAQTDESLQVLKDTSLQLDEARTTVAQLTAQLERSEERPEVTAERDRLAQRLAQLEAEAAVLVDRAQSAESRTEAIRQELDSAKRAQKDAAVSALASLENVRLEKARREDLSVQLEDVRGKLKRSFESVNDAQRETEKESAAHAATKEIVHQLRQSLVAKDNALALAAERELALAEARNTSNLAVEHLEHALLEAKKFAAAFSEELETLRAEKASLERTQALHRQDKVEQAAAIERLQAQEQAAAKALEAERQKVFEQHTELESARAAHARSLRDTETLAVSEQSLRSRVTQLEAQLQSAGDSLHQLAEDLTAKESALSEEQARSKRLERDFETAIGLERNARAQAETANAESLQQMVRFESELALKNEQLSTVQASAQSEVNRFAAEMQVANESLAAAQARVVLLEERLHLSLAEHQAKFEAQTLAATAVEATLEAERREHAAETQGLRERLAAESNGRKELAQTHEAKLKELALLRTQLDAVQTLQRETAVALAATTEEKRAAVASAESMTQAHQEATQTINALRVDIVTAQQRSEAEQRAYVALNQAFASLQTDAQLAAERSVALEQALASQSAEMRGLAETSAHVQREQQENLETLSQQLRAANLAREELQKQHQQQVAVLTRSLEEVGAAKSTVEEQISALNASLEGARSNTMQLEVQLNNSQQHVAQLRTENASLTEQTGELETRVGEQDAQLQLAQSAQAQLASQLQKERETRQQLEATLAAQDEAAARAEQAAQSLQASQELERAAKAELQQKLDALEREWLEQGQQLESLRAEQTRLIETADLRSEEIQTLNDLTAQLKQQHIDAVTALDQSRLSREDLTKELLTAQRALEAETSARAQASARSLDLEAELQALQARESEFHQAVAQGNSAAQLERDRSVELAAQVAALNEARAQAVEQMRLLIESSTKERQVEAERFGQLQQELEALTAFRAEASARLAQAAHNETEFANTRAALESELSRVRADFVASGQNSAQLAKRVENLEAALSASLDKADVLQAELDVANASGSRLVVDVRAFEAALDAEGKRVAQMRQELDAAREERAAVQAQREAAEKRWIEEKASLQGAVRDLTDARTLALQQFNEAQETIKRLEALRLESEGEQRAIAEQLAQSQRALEAQEAEAQKAAQMAAAALESERRQFDASQAALRGEFETEMQRSSSVHQDVLNAKLDELAEAQKRNGELAAQLKSRSSADAAAAQLRVEYDQLRIDFQRAKATQQATMEKLSSAEKAVVHQKELINRLSPQLESAEQQRFALASEASTAKTRAEQAVASLKTSEQTLQALRQELATVSKAQQLAEAELSSLRPTLAELQSKSEEHQAEAAAQRALLESLKVERDSLRKQTLGAPATAVAPAELARAQAEKQQTTELLLALRNKYAELQASHQTTSNAFELARNEFARLKNQIVDLQQAKANLEVENERLTRLEAAAERSAAAVPSLHRQVGDLERRLDKAKSGVFEMPTTSEQLSELDKLFETKPETRVKVDEDFDFDIESQEAEDLLVFDESTRKK